MDYSNTRVFAKHLQSPSVIHQVCIGDWTRQQNGQQKIITQADVVFGKGSFLSIHRFTAYEADSESRPTGTLTLLHEQPVYGTIKDIKVLQCMLEPEDGIEASADMDVDNQQDRPKLGYLPKGASSSVLVVTSDSGVLSFLTFHYEQDKSGAMQHGRFYVLKELEIAEPGFDYLQPDAKIAIDPTSKIVAVSALQNLIKLIIIRGTKRTQFDPVERVSTIEIKGVIIDMDFLAPEPDEAADVAILAVLFYSKTKNSYNIATFHIGLQNRLNETLSIRLGTSQIETNSLKSVVLLKALPNIPRSMVYIDEEKVTLVTVDIPTNPGSSNTDTHTHHSSLQLMKKESSESADRVVDTPTNDLYPLIAACATTPCSPSPASDQTLYLGSDSSELYRINIQHLTYSMQFELATSDKPVGHVMQVIARHQFTTQPILSDADQDIVLNTDYLLYSNDYGDGGILGIKEEEDGIDLFAISELKNSSPIIDFCMREPTYPGRDSLYICSGMKGEGSIKRARSGIAVESSGGSGNEFFSGSTGLWSARESLEQSSDSYLIVSFVQSTKLLLSDEGGGLDDISENCGLDLSQATVHAGRFMDNMIFQVHRTGVIVVNTRSGARHSWVSPDGIITSACLVKDGALALGHISSGCCNLILLEMARSELAPSTQGAQDALVIAAMKSTAEEITTIHCWEQATSIGQPTSKSVFCCLGTLEPAVLVFQIINNEIQEIYRESLAGREDVSIPHSIRLLQATSGQHKIVVGLRDGSLISYGWNWPHGEMNLTNQPRSRVLSSPRLFKLGVLPVKFAHSANELNRVLILSDKLWLASFELDLKIQPILFDSDVSQACSFISGDESQQSKPGFIFVVDQQDIQLVTLEGASKYNIQTLELKQTPRRILDITSKRVLLVATVQDAFPFARSVLQLIDPDRVTNDGGSGKDHIVAEFVLGVGEAVYCLTEWRIPRPNKSDAVYICVGTGIFHPTGSELSAAAPKTGRLIVLSIKHTKKADKRSRRFELDLRWAMVMPAPVFAISTFMDMKLLISNGRDLKLLVLDLEKKTLVERASHRERWPIVQISSHGSMICTGSKRESICFYEYRESNGDIPDKLEFLKSASSSRQVTDCIAISPEFAIGVDISGSIFGVGYSKDDLNCQYSLIDRFSFHLGEIMTRIRMAKIWPADERSLAGIPLSQRTKDRDAVMDIREENTDNNGDSHGLRPTPGQLTSWILLPWTTPHYSSTSTLSQLTQSTLTTPAISSQALVACTQIGSFVGFWRLHPLVYDIIGLLQSIMQVSYETRPILGNMHDRYRSLSSAGKNSIDGNLVNQFLGLDHELQVLITSKAVGLERIVEEWIQAMDISQENRAYLRNSNLNDQSHSAVGCFLHSHPADQAPCTVSRVICNILSFLYSLDWHQK